MSLADEEAVSLSSNGFEIRAQVRIEVRYLVPDKNKYIARQKLVHEAQDVTQADIYRHMRMLRPVVEDQVAQEGGPCRITGSHADAVFKIVLLALDRFQGIFVQPLHDKGMLVERLAVSRQAHAARRPVEQADTQRTFQLFQVEGQGRLGHAQPFGGVADRAGIGNGKKLKQGPVHQRVLRAIDFFYIRTEISYFSVRMANGKVSALRQGS